MFSTINEILDVYRTDDYVVTVEGDTIGLVDTFDGTAVWYKLYPRSFYYFAGRTDVKMLDRDTWRKKRVKEDDGLEVEKGPTPG